MKQTAVQWLIKELINYDKLLDGKRKNNDATVFKANPTKIYEQAKAMEKEQIKDAHLIGLITSMEMEATKQAEQYYQETYKSE